MFQRSRVVVFVCSYCWALQSETCFSFGLAQVRIDAAFTLFYRDVLQQSRGPLYLWCDSSPQLGADYLLSIFDRISEEQLVPCWQHAQALFKSVLGFCDAFHAGDQEQMAQQVHFRHEAARFLKKHVVRHRQMPMSLGSGATTLEDKGRALAMKFAHECHTIQDLRSVCAQVCSLTVDMDVEVGLADAAGGDVNQYLPAWTQDSGLVADEGLAALEALGEQSDRHLFPNSFVSTGLDHISNNLQSDLDEHLSGWKTWLPKFKALTNLCSKRHHLNRLIARCIRDTPFAPLTRMFETAVPPCAKWRWGTICKSLPAILERHRPLSMIWNKAKFLGGTELDGDDDDDNRLDVDHVTEALQSPSWLAYGQMILHLHEIANFISGWGSGCKCHEWLRPHKGSSTSVWDETLQDVIQSLQLPTDSDGMRYQCPLAGKRAPELASGVLVKALNDKIQEVYPKVLVESSAVGGTEQEHFLNDFNLGTGYIKLVVELKLGHWQDFPWVLCKLGLPGDDERKRAAADLLAVFNKLPQTPESHHRVTWAFMQQGSTLRVN